MTDYGLEGKLKEAFDFLSLINQTAYKDLYLLSNDVFSKNPFGSTFLEKFLKREVPKPVNIFTILSKLLIYYLKSFVYFGLYLLFFLAFYISRLKFVVNPLFKDLILIDTFSLIDKFEKSGTFQDPYFSGLKEVLEKLGKHYAYLPVFYTTKNPLRLFNIFRLSKKSKVPVLTEYQLLASRDLMKIFFFILIYPVKVLIFAKSIKEKTYESKLLKRELIDNLAYITFLKFSRYLQGRKISALTYEEIKLISWFENQSIDKNLYKGIRESRDNVKIYGAQPFIFPKSLLNILADENETKFGTVPDKIIVSGPYFIPSDTTLNFVVGPSFRYKKLFTIVIDEKKQKDLMVLLPYFVEDVRNIVSLLAKTDFPVQSFIIKAHPATPIEKFRGLIPTKATVVYEDLYELFKTAKIVIGSASGTMVEAASLGIPVISIKNIQRFDCNPLPIYGKGIIWDEVTNSTELGKMVAKFEDALKNTDELAKIKEVAYEYKKMFFCRPTDDSIIRAYDLDHQEACGKPRPQGGF